MVSLRSPEDYSILCSGALICGNVVITSASCFMNTTMFVVHIYSENVTVMSHQWPMMNNMTIKQSKEVATLVIDHDALFPEPYVSVEPCMDFTPSGDKRSNLVFESVGGTGSRILQTSKVSLEPYPCGQIKLTDETSIFATSYQRLPCGRLETPLPCNGAIGGLLLERRRGKYNVIHSALGVAAHIDCGPEGTFSWALFASTEPAAEIFNTWERPESLPRIWSGSGNTGSGDGSNLQASFHNPHGMVKIAETVYITDTLNNAIRYVDLLSSEKVGTVAVITSGLEEFRPRGLASQGGSLYVTGNHGVVMVEIASGEHQVITGALGGEPAGYRDGTLASARFSSPRGIAVLDRLLYVADLNNAIRVINPSEQSLKGQPGQTVTTLSSASTGRRMHFVGPHGVLPFQGDKLIVSDKNRILVVYLEDKRKEVLAGKMAQGSADGKGRRAQFSGPTYMVLKGEELILSDTGNAAIRSVNTQTGEVQTLFKGQGIFEPGNPRVATMGTLEAPLGLILRDPDDDESELYVVDSGDHRIKRFPQDALNGDRCTSEYGSSYPEAATAESSLIWFG